MATRPEIIRIIHVSSNGVGVVFGSNASSPVPSADRGSPFYGEISRDLLIKDSKRDSFYAVSPRVLPSSDKQILTC